VETIIFNVEHVSDILQSFKTYLVFNLPFLNNHWSDFQNKRTIRKLSSDVFTLAVGAQMT